jgi:hypothetical protein
MEERF